MRGPLRALAATVVGQDDESGFAFVFRHGLDLLPEFAQVAVGQVSGIEIVGVGAAVGPVVGLAQADEEYARLAGLQIGERGVEGQGIEGLVLPDVHGFGLQAIQQRKFGRLWNGSERIPAGVDDQTRMFLVEDAVEDSPCTEGGHTAFEAGLVVEPGKDRRIGIGAIVVRVDARIDQSGQRFGVARIAEEEGIGDVGVGSEIAVAEDLSFGGDG